MPAGTNAKVVLVTCGSRAEARKIAQAVVAKRLAACVNVVTAPVESVYRWKERVERATEFLLVIKTTGGRLKRLEEAVLGLHAYDVPEFLVVGIAGGSRRYLDWLGQSVRGIGAK
jgi:periplasmic divalent cation tolerance protein